MFIIEKEHFLNFSKKKNGRHKFANLGVPDQVKWGFLNFSQLFTSYDNYRRAKLLGTCPLEHWKLQKNNSGEFQGSEIWPIQSLICHLNSYFAIFIQSQGASAVLGGNQTSRVAKLPFSRLKQLILSSIYGAKRGRSFEIYWFETE